MRSARQLASGLFALALALTACSQSAPPPLATGTFAPAEGWTARNARPIATRRHALTHRVGEVLILGGDAETVSGLDGQLGLRLDEDRNDVAALTRRVAEAGADAEAILVLFTTFDDRGSGGPAYYVPLFSDTTGIGRPPVDQRPTFGVERLVGFANLKRRESHAEAERVPLLVHEIAHQHLAYLEAEPTETATAVPLLGRQRAHWHAALHTDGSVLGGHGLTEIEAGRFVVSRREVALSSFDLYGLGLLEPERVEPTFFVEGARVDGFPLPPEARLDVGAELTGTRRRVTIDDVIRAVGPRRPARREPETRLVFALLTAPDVAVTSSAAVAEARAVDALRQQLRQAWPDYTRGRGALCTALWGCAPSTVDAGALDAGDAGSIAEPAGGCRAGESAGGGLAALLGCLAATWRGRRRRAP